MYQTFIDSKTRRNTLQDIDAIHTKYHRTAASSYKLENQVFINSKNKEEYTAGIQNLISQLEDVNDVLPKRPKLEDLHPREALQTIATHIKADIRDVTFAKYMDAVDPLAYLRDYFHYPKKKTLMHIDASLTDIEEDCVYFCGNSLGLMPKQVKNKLDREMDKWANMGVHGHLNGDMPWAYCDEVIEASMARVVGGKEGEVGLMNGLTVNLHLLLISFYRPTETRCKILCEAKAFPSDHYAFESEIKLKGYDPAECLICMTPRKGEHLLRPEDIITRIKEEGDSIAVVCFSGVQYYTGQLFDMEAITKAGHEKGCVVGFDLAHAVGNVPIYLHDWNVDFACWCTYKYLCAGAGGIAGAFIHEKHAINDYPKLLGWWSHKMDTRFKMDNVMDLEPGIHGYRISNPPPMLCAPLEASLDILDMTSMENLREKSLLLTAYLELLLESHYPKPRNGEVSSNPYVEIITPKDPKQRGCQLSVMFSCPVFKAFSELEKRGVVCDKRDPNVLRLAPKHMYNSFEDVWKFIDVLHIVLQSSTPTCCRQ